MRLGLLATVDLRQRPLVADCDQRQQQLRRTLDALFLQLREDLVSHRKRCVTAAAMHREREDPNVEVQALVGVSKQRHRVRVTRRCERHAEPIRTVAVGEQLAAVMGRIREKQRSRFFRQVEPGDPLEQPTALLRVQVRHLLDCSDRMFGIDDPGDRLPGLGAPLLQRKQVFELPRESRVGKPVDPRVEPSPSVVPLSERARRTHRSLPEICGNLRFELLRAGDVDVFRRLDDFERAPPPRQLVQHEPKARDAALQMRNCSGCCPAELWVRRTCGGCGNRCEARALARGELALRAPIQRIPAMLIAAALGHGEDRVGGQAMRETLRSAAVQHGLDELEVGMR